MRAKNSDRGRKNKNFGASVGKPSGVVQVFRTPAKDCRQHRRKAGTHDHDTTTEGEQESRRAAPEESRQESDK